MRALGPAFLVVCLCTSPAPAADPEPITAQELGEFAEHLQLAASDRDAAGINELFDLRAMLDRATRGLEVSRRDRRFFLSDLRQSFDLGTLIVQTLGEFGTYTPLATRVVEGEPRVLFRMLSHEDGLNYHDLVLARSRTGAPVIVDIYVFMDGELTSRRLHRTCARYLEGATTPSPALQMETLLAEGRFREGLRFYDSLPRRAKTDKLLNIQRVICAQQVGPEALDDACDDLLRMYPDDPGVQLVVFDRYFLRERWPQTLDALARIKRAVGDDPYLDVLAGFVHHNAGDHDRARVSVEDAIRREPTLEQAHVALLNVVIAQRDHEATAKVLGDLERIFGYVYDERFFEHEAYEHFVTSEAFTRWRDTRMAAQAE